MLSTGKPRDCCLGLGCRFSVTSNPFREGLSVFLIVCPLPSGRWLRVISRPFKPNSRFFLATSSIQSFFISTSSFLARLAKSSLGSLCRHVSAQLTYCTRPNQTNSTALRRLRFANSLLSRVFTKYLQYLSGSTVTWNPMFKYHLL